MKGFKDKSGKFRPTGNKTKSSLKKSDVKRGKVELEYYGEGLNKHPVAGSPMYEEYLEKYPNSSIGIDVNHTWGFRGMHGSFGNYLMNGDYENAWLSADSDNKKKMMELGYDDNSKYGRHKESLEHTHDTRDKKSFHHCPACDKANKEAEDFESISKLYPTESTRSKFTLEDYEKNEDINYHMENAVELVDEYGTFDEKREIHQIQKNHEDRGHILSEEMQRREEISGKYYDKLVADSKKKVSRSKETLTDAQKVMQDYEFEFKKGQAQHYMEISLKRPLTETELKRYKQLAKELGYQG